MTTTERQQSLADARRACEWLWSRVYDLPMQDMCESVKCLLVEFERLDEKERNQAKAGTKGAVHGVKGGRPKKTGGKK